MPTCATIDADVLYSCDNPPISGAKDLITVINKSEINTVTYNTTDTNIVENLTLNSGGKKAYKYEGTRRSVEPVQTLIRRRYLSLFKHEVRFKVMKMDTVSKGQLNKFPNGLFVVIVEMNYRGPSDDGNGRWEVYGLKSGLECMELTRTVNDTETGGSYDVLFASDEEGGLETALPATYWKTDESTTKTNIDALYTATA